jgi:rRNA maturation RNase YbeY
VAISFFTEDCSYSLPQKQLTKKWLKSVIENFGFSVGTINYIFCSDKEILKKNNEYLGHNYYTDIITFPYTDNTKVSSDIFISIDTVKSNSEKFNQNFHDELNRVMVHGVLHLVGFDDKSKSDKIKMREEENKCLIMLNTLHY